MHGKKEQPVHSSLPEGDPINNPLRTNDVLNLADSTPTPTHVESADIQTESDPVNEGELTWNKTLQQQIVSALAHLDKTITVIPQEEKGQPIAEREVEKIVIGDLISSERESAFNLRAQAENSAPDRVSSRINMAKPATDFVVGGSLRNNSEQVKQKSLADDFKPAQFYSEVGNASGNKPDSGRFYATVRTVDLWNREPKTMNFLPSGSGSDSAELDQAFASLKQRDFSSLDNLENKKVEPQSVLHPFQEKLVEFKRRRQE